MTLVLKSNTQLSLKDSFFKSSINGAVMGVDFRTSETYSSKGNLNLSDIVKVEQRIETGRLDSIGDYYTVPSNTPVISTSNSGGSKGLLIDSYLTNNFLNSTNPQTQAISLPSYTPIADGSKPFTVTMQGSGKLTVKDGATVLGVATQGNDFSYIASPSATSITVQVDGAVSFAGVYTPNVAHHRNTAPVFRQATSATSPSYPESVIYVSASLINSLISSSTGSIVLKRKENFDVSQTKNFRPMTSTVMQFASSNKNGLFVSKNFNWADRKYLLRAYDGTEILSMDNATQHTSETVFVLNFSKTKAELYINGKLSSNLTYPQIELGDLYLGAARPYWSNSTPHIIEQFTVFNRWLTATEAERLSSAAL